MNKVSRQPDYVFDPNHYPITPGLRLIEASAGTGKTFALAHIVLRLLTEGKQSLRQLLVVTFTDASAAELRARIGLRLEAALDGLEALAGGSVPKASDPVLQEWLEQTGLEQQQRKTEQQINAQRQQWICQLLEALEGLDQADITTIHGFCRRTLRR
ncbi:MAG: UvrD-helicase domain-containing protein, partial [Prochlorococcus sp.]|nr:UvrD-helicase domain-containing protein [Prochlorococcus sp.]